MSRKGKSLVISYGKYGGVYFHRGYSTRLCLGWIAVTYIPDDVDNLFERLLLTKISEKERAWIKKSQDLWSAWEKGARE